MANNISFNIRAVEARVVNAVKQAVEEVALDLMSKAQLLAPIDTGDLRGSASVSPIEETSTEIKCTVGFSEEYALRQHEDMGLRHPMGGQAKYLEEPTKRNETRYKNYIKDAARNGVGT